MPGTTRGLRIGRIAGAPVIVSPSALLLVLLVAVAFAPTFALASDSTGSLIFLTVCFALLLAASVLLHEIAHALVAKRFAVRSGEIVITGWGGHTTFEERMPSPRAEAATSAAGPLANAVCAAAFYAIALALRASAVPHEVTMLAFAAAWANLFVALFNLLPGLPLDGGQILESLVWAITKSRYRGTVVAGWIGRIVAIGVGLWVIVLPFVRGGAPDMIQAMWGLLIAMYLWGGASRALSMAKHAQRLDALDPMSLGHPAIAIPESGTLADADAALARNPGAAVVLLGSRGQPVGIVESAAADAVQPAMRASVPLSGVSVRLPAEAAVPASLHGPQLAHALGHLARETDWVAILDQSGRVVGVLRVTDVIAALR